MINITQDLVEIFQDTKKLRQEFGVTQDSIDKLLEELSRDIIEHDPSQAEII